MALLALYNHQSLLLPWETKGLNLLTLSHSLVLDHCNKMNLLSLQDNKCSGSRVI